MKYCSKNKELKITANADDTNIRNHFDEHILVATERHISIECS